MGALRRRLPRGTRPHNRHGRMRPPIPRGRDALRHRPSGYTSLCLRARVRTFPVHTAGRYACAAIYSDSSSLKRSRARNRRDFTVPREQLRISAISS